MLQTKLNNSFCKITIFTYVFLLILFLNRGREVGKAYTSLCLVLFLIPFLIFRISILPPTLG